MGQTPKGLKVKQKACMQERKGTNVEDQTIETETQGLSHAQSREAGRYAGLVVKKDTSRALVQTKARPTTNQNTRGAVAEEKPQW